LRDWMLPVQVDCFHSLLLSLASSFKKLIVGFNTLT
jgi:hypothetical protein